MRLGKLICFYDDNSISIDGGTDLAFTEDVTGRFTAYGFHCLSVADGDNDLDAIARAIREAQQVTDRPSLIRVKTTIGFASKLQGTEKVHGAPLGADEVQAVKRALGLESYGPFQVDPDVYAHYRQVRERQAKGVAEWNAAFMKYSETYPADGEEFLRRLAKKYPDNLLSLLPRYEPGTAELATRKLSETVLNAIAPVLPELIGGSADLTHSNLTKWKGSVDFQAGGGQLGSYAGRYLRFGVREHGMFGICNGIAAYGGLVPFASTFLNFISYGLGSVRLAALAHHHVIYIMTHDSIGLGEDGPTHQPIETLAGLRALPNILVLRPADGNEVSGAYWQALQHRDRPTVLCLSRQNLPQLRGSLAEAVARGAYTLSEHGDAASLKIVLVATGSEVPICVAAAETLANSGLATRVVSMPSWELFDCQPLAYRQSVLPGGVPIISVEALSPLGWSRYAHVQIGMASFGASGPYKQVYAKFGFTPEAIAAKARQTVAFYQDHPVPNLLADVPAL